MSTPRSAQPPVHRATEPRGLTPARVVSHLGVMAGLAVIVGLLVGGLSVLPSVALGWASKGVAGGLESFPQALSANPLPQRTRVLSRGGQVIAIFYDQNRVNVPMADIAPVMRKAIVDIEDNRFYHHGALDLKGTVRAFLTNQSNGATVQGGSSITQQMAKMTILLQARNAAERAAATADTIKRKVKELRVAIAFEQHYSKKWILNRYLNIAYFGDGAYGIQSAARHYFSVDAKDLTLPQAALLAGLVKNPDGYNPRLNPASARDRRNIVLERMAQLGDVKQATADRLTQTGLGLKVSNTQNGCIDSTAPWYCDYTLKYLLTDPQLGATRTDRMRLINSGGLTIKTNLDLRFQQAADNATSNRAYPTDNAVAAIAEVVPGTGAVRALSQSRPMGLSSTKGETYINYTIPTALGGALGFPGGSTFKAFVLAAAMEQGISPYTSFNSPYKLTIQQNSYPDCKGNYPINAPWDLQNFDKSEAGNFSVITGTQKSVNTFYAQLERQTGLCQPFRIAKSLGVDLGPGDRVPSFTLGAAGESPLTMASAYATWAARGMYCEPQPVTQILNSDGKVFKDYKPNCKRAVSQYAADWINSILHGVMAPGQFGGLLALSVPSAGKTGTTEDNKAVWFDGYTPTLSTSSVVGGANQQGTPITLNNQYIGGTYSGAHAYGSTVAGPMWYSAMYAIEGYLPYKDFYDPSHDQAPPGASTSTSNGSVPSVVGMDEATAQSTLAQAGYIVVIGAAQPSTSYPKGTIASQSPTSGSPAASGTSVTIYPSAG